MDFDPVQITCELRSTKNAEKSKDKRSFLFALFDCLANSDPEPEPEVEPEPGLKLTM